MATNRELEGEVRSAILGLMLVSVVALGQEPRDFSYVAPIGGLKLREFLERPKAEKIAYVAGYVDGLSHMGSEHTYDGSCLREITVDDILKRLEADATKYAYLTAWAAMRYVLETECPN